MQTPYHCTCFECHAKEVAMLFNYMFKRGTVTRLTNENVYEQSLIVPVHGGYLQDSVLIWNPKGKDYCAFVSNCTDGFNAFVHYLNHHRHINATGYSALNDKDYPFYHFFRYELDGLRRYVRTMKDDPRWEFYQKGEPFEFEDVSRCSRRLKRERLDRDMVIEYMRQMGYDLEDPLFYETDECYLVEGV